MFGCSGTISDLVQRGHAHGRPGSPWAARWRSPGPAKWVSTRTPLGLLLSVQWMSQDRKYRKTWNPLKPHSYAIANLTPGSSSRLQSFHTAQALLDPGSHPHLPRGAVRMELLGENLTPSECYTKWKQMEAIKIQNHQNHCVCCGKSNHGCWDAPHEESETIYSERLDRFIDAECRVSTCLRESPMSRKLGSSFSVLSCACDATWESCKVLESWNETGSSATSVKTHSRLGMVQNWASNPASLVMFNVELSVLGGLNHTQVWYYAHPKNIVVLHVFVCFCALFNHHFGWFMQFIYAHLKQPWHDCPLFHAIDGARSGAEVRATAHESAKNGTVAASKHQRCRLISRSAMFLCVCFCVCVGPKMSKIVGMFKNVLDCFGMSQDVPSTSCTSVSQRSVPGKLRGPRFLWTKNGQSLEDDLLNPQLFYSF